MPKVQSILRTIEDSDKIQARWRYRRNFWLVVGAVLSLWLTGVVLSWILRFLGLFSN